MKTYVIVLVMLACSVSLMHAETTGKVVKSEQGNCTGKNTTFKEKHWVDLDNDDKADYTVTTWCNGKVSVTPLGLVSGRWPESHDSWTASLVNQSTSQAGGLQYAFVYRDKSSDAVIGSEVLDTIDPTSAKVAFYTSVLMAPTVTDPDNQEPVGIITDNDPRTTSFTFEAYEQGLYRITVHLRSEDGGETVRDLELFVNQAGQMTLPYELRSGETVYGFTLHRPNRGSHESSFR